MATKSKQTKTAGMVKTTGSDGSFASQVKALTKTFDIANMKTVQDFLAEHAHLMPLLAKMHPVIRSIFPDEQLILEVVEDPYGPEGTGLLLYIVVAGTAKDGLERLEQFDQIWLHDDCKLCVNLRFK